MRKLFVLILLICAGCTSIKQEYSVYYEHKEKCGDGVKVGYKLEVTEGKKG